MAELRETHVVKSDVGGKSGATPWLAFIVGALLIAVVALLVMNVHGSISGPSGRIDFNVKPPATSGAPAPAAPAPATAPATR